MSSVCILLEIGRSPPCEAPLEDLFKFRGALRSALLVWGARGFFFTRRLGGQGGRDGILASNPTSVSQSPSQACLSVVRRYVALASLASTLSSMEASHLYSSSKARLTFSIFLRQKEWGFGRLCSKGDQRGDRGRIKSTERLPEARAVGHILEELLSSSQVYKDPLQYSKNKCCISICNKELLRGCMIYG